MPPDQTCGSTGTLIGRLTDWDWGEVGSGEVIHSYTYIQPVLGSYSYFNICIS